MRRHFESSPQAPTSGPSTLIDLFAGGIETSSYGECKTCRHLASSTRASTTRPSTLICLLAGEAEIWRHRQWTMLRSLTLQLDAHEQRYRRKKTRSTADAGLPLRYQPCVLPARCAIKSVEQPFWCAVLSPATQLASCPPVLVCVLVHCLVTHAACIHVQRPSYKHPRGQYALPPTVGC